MKASLGFFLSKIILTLQVKSFLPSWEAFFPWQDIYSCYTNYFPVRCIYSRFYFPSLTGNVFLLISCVFIYFPALKQNILLVPETFPLFWYDRKLLLPMFFLLQKIHSCYMNALGWKYAHITDTVFPFSYRKCILAYFLCSH